MDRADRVSYANPPLVEAIFELHWESAGQLSENLLDQSEDLLPGQIFERLGSKYPYHERLPTAMIPGRMIPNQVQHRFRAKQGGWPVVQVGPTVVTLNDTTEYRWNDFRARAIELASTLFSLLAEQPRPKVAEVQLRYINAVPLGEQAENVVSFLQSELGVNFSVPAALFDSSGVDPIARDFDLGVTFVSKQPPGMIALRFSSAIQNAVTVLRWEEALVSKEDDAPQTEEAISEWLDAADRLTHQWFFCLMQQGNLHKKANPCRS